MAMRTILMNGAWAALAVISGTAGGQSLPCGTPLFPAQQVMFEDRPRAVASDDLDGDGAADLVARRLGGLTVAFGEGDGSFGPQANYESAVFLDAVVIEDLDGDGDADLAAAGREIDEPYRGRAVIYLNHGDGTFAEPLEFGTTFVSNAITAADLNGDGVPDLAVVNLGDLNGEGMGVSVLLGNGDGTFQHVGQYPVGQSPRSVAAADVDGDGDLDLATANEPDNAVTLLLNHGDGSFETGEILPVGLRPRWLVSSDFNGDGASDIAVANWHW